MPKTKTRSSKREKNKLLSVDRSPGLYATDLIMPTKFTDFLEVFGMPPQRTPKKVRHSRIRVQLNRPLTYAHVEDITHKGLQFKLSVAPNRTHLWAEGPMTSRQMFDIVEKVLAENYTNYFVRAVRTFSEYSGHVPQ